MYKDIESYMEKFRAATAGRLKRLDFKTSGFTELDLDREFHIELSYKSSILAQKKTWKLRDVIAAYQNAYCGKIGVEFTHIPEKEICDWIRINFEGI